MHASPTVRQMARQRKHEPIEIAKLDALALGVPGDLRLLRLRGLLHRLADGLLHGLSSSSIGTEAATKFVRAREIPVTGH